MVKNESDVIETFVRHNVRFVDAMLIIDNGSTDGTRAILASLTREGLPVVVYDDPRPGYVQSERMTALYGEALRYFAPDGLLMLDADEFLRVDSRSALDAALASVPPGHYGIIPWQTFVLRTEDQQDDTVSCLERMRWRRLVRTLCG